MRSRRICTRFYVADFCAVRPDPTEGPSGRTGRYTNHTMPLCMVECTSCVVWLGRRSSLTHLPNRIKKRKFFVSFCVIFQIDGWSHAFGIDGMGPIGEATLIQSHVCNLLISQCLTLVFVLSISFSIVFSVSLNENPLRPPRMKCN